MTFKVYLKANDRIFVNGAVLRVDRKATLEFLNEVSFLLQNQILQPEKADTPLKQLYYIIQIMLMAPNDTVSALSVYRSQMAALLQTCSDQTIGGELKNVDRLVHEQSYHAAMKSVRALFKIEEAIAGGTAKVTVGKLIAIAQMMRCDESPVTLPIAGII